MHVGMNARRHECTYAFVHTHGYSKFNDLFINIGTKIESIVPQTRTSFISFLKNANEKCIV